MIGSVGRTLLARRNDIDVAGDGSYQLTSVASFRWYTPSQCTRVPLVMLI